MLGYEPSSDIGGIFSDFVVALHNEELPVYELSEALGSVASRIPSLLGEYLYDTIAQIKANSTSLNISLIQEKIKSVVSSLPLDDQDPTLAVLLPIRDILDRYSQGVESRAISILLGFLESYHKLESLYEGSTQARVILGLRDVHKGNLEFVRDIARSFLRSESRSLFILQVLEFFSKETDVKIRLEASEKMKSLALLAGMGSARVSFRAREILVDFQTPSLEDRRSAILSIFQKVVKMSAGGSKVFFDFSQLTRTISSRHAMLDILPELFFHSEVHTRAIALYTYIMRTNRAYTITSFEHHFLEKSVVLSWDFENQEQSLFSPYRDLQDPLLQIPVNNSVVRKGIIFTCDTLDDLVDQVKTAKPLLNLPSADGSEPKKFSIRATVAIKADSNLATDELAAENLSAYISEHRDFLKKYMIRRCTFLVLVPGAQSRYFTFKASRDYTEDITIRHIEPFMAHRLEIDRLANFEIKPCLIGSGDRGVRIYHAVGKSNSADVRFFVRGIIHPSSVSTFHDFFLTEGNRITANILDTLELLIVSHPNTDCNHILLHFIPVFSTSADQVQFYLDQLLRRHSARFAKLRITDVEICYTGYHPSTKEVIPFRILASIQSQYVIDSSWYSQKKTENDVETLFSLTTPVGPLHGRPVSRPHAPKQSIQPKRYRAHLLGTAYVYDFPAIFKEALKQRWSKLRDIVPPSKIMECKELILNSRGDLEESDQPPGTF